MQAVDQAPDATLWRWLKLAGRSAPEHVLVACGIDPKQSRPPVPVEAVAERLGVRVARTDQANWSGALDFHEGQAILWVNGQEAPTRQRFTISHELGHLMLHDEGLVWRDVGFNGDSRESQANRFAANLLMPAWMVHRAVDVIPWRSALALAFDVSPQAMEFRLKELGLLGATR